MRTVLLGFLAVLTAAAAFLGFQMGAAGAADETDVIDAREQATSSAFALANMRAIGDGVRRGATSGREAGIQEAQSSGQQRGTAIARDVIADRTTRAGRSDDGVTELPVAAGDGDVLIVGDSLEVGTSPYLGPYLPGVPIKVSAEVGYSSDAIYGLFEDGFDPSQSVVVFDAGTNDSPTSSEILAGNLRAVASAIGDRCMVVPTINGPTIGGADSSALNRVVQQFAADRPGTQVPDWSGAVRLHPELMQPDGIHALPEGYDLRASLVADGISACLGDFGSLSLTP